jgi:hypothetical protein
MLFYLQEESIWYKKPQFNTPDALQQLADRLISVPIESESSRTIKFGELCETYFTKDDRSKPKKNDMKNHRSSRGAKV